MINMDIPSLNLNSISNYLSDFNSFIGSESGAESGASYSLAETVAELFMPNSISVGLGALRIYRTFQGSSNYSSGESHPLNYSSLISGRLALVGVLSAALIMGRVSWIDNSGVRAVENGGLAKKLLSRMARKIESSFA